MFFGLLVLFTALTISAVAIWYSVAGLVAIFAAAAVPIIIMGTSLEIGKLVTALWLHRNWKRAKWWLKSYLTIAVVVLMFITSMGIFGFLSKAHIEQNLASDTVEQRIEILEGKIIAEEKYIERQNDTIDRISNKDKNSNNRFDKDIAIEQKKIDDAYARLEVLDKDVEAFTSNNKGWGGTKRVKQGLALKEQQAPEREALLKQIEKAQLKIDEIRSKNDQSLDSIDVKIEAVEKNIFDANSRIDGYLLEIEPLKGDVMKLESEVGPIRYIAEFVYGEEADRNLLEEAVRWVIITIIFVFDPLAVLLLIASQYTFEWRRHDKKLSSTDSDPEPIAEDTKDSDAQMEEALEEEKSEDVGEQIRIEDEDDDGIKGPHLLKDNEIEELLEKADPETLEEVAKELGVESQLIRLSDSGYRKVTCNNYELFIDVGNIIVPLSAAFGAAFVPLNIDVTPPADNVKSPDPFVATAISPLLEETMEFPFTSNAAVRLV